MEHHTYDTQLFKRKMKHNVRRGLSTGKWVICAAVIGVLVGLCSGLFGFFLRIVTDLRLSHPYLLLLLPVGAVLIVGLYHKILHQKDPGTNLVLSAIHSDDEIPLRMAPLIFISTLITHFVGGSAGREGAALQLGGSIGNAIGHFLGLDRKEDRHVFIMCGMSAAFSALFGTPMAAAVFSMEVVSVGIMHYAALLPCTVAALIARAIAAEVFHILPMSFVIEDIPELTLLSACEISLFAVLCGFVSMLFCILLHQSGHHLQRLFPNPYLRAFAGGCFLLLLTALVGSQTYNGTGTSMIADCIQGDVDSAAFLIKMLFTSLTLACGYKGGEIIPTLFIGASFGSLFGNLLGFSPSLCAAVGMGALFCGVTNCPITSLLICFELFGLKGLPFFLLAVGFSYTVSGYFGLYSSQKIVYSKYKSNYIDKQAE